ncbi:MAG: Nif11-like leader peptide family natural product precursor [Syntrophales bacterium]|nr:Nif11-like leader peptide family natural product precursor [Syntrophales bacterium]MDD5640201.1 Nif11-like leader peptide family natural product precursor [Syntrophales bacterium]
MSVQSARDFLKRIGADQAFKDRIAAAPDHEARQEMVRAAGFDFNLDELKEAVKEVAAAAGRELTPAELQDIAGGFGKSFKAGSCIVKTNPAPCQFYR